MLPSSSAFFGSILLLTQATFIAAGPIPAGHEYQAPGPGDVRSPCPGINTMANHGFIPRNGKNISPQVVAAGLLEGLNVGLDFGLLVGAGATASNPNPLAGTFNMDQLREHNFPIEHDVSLLRQDYYQGDNLHFNQSVFNEVLSFYSGMAKATVPVGAHALWSRVHTQRRINGNKLIFGPRQLTLSLVETSLYLSVMGDPVSGNAPVNYVKSFFEKERLPYEMGWSKPTVETNFATLAAMAAQLIAADPGDLILDAQNLNEGSIRDVFQLKDPITGVAINATCALAGLC